MSKRLLAAVALVCCAPSASALVTCGIVSSPGVMFGLYDTLSLAPTDTAGSLQVRCANNGGGSPWVTVTVGIGTGANGSAVSNRKMRHMGGAGDLLSYGLFRDAGRSAVWGYTMGVDTQTQSVQVQNRRAEVLIFTIYGRLPPQQNVSIGNYGDTVQVTVSP